MNLNESLILLVDDTPNNINVLRKLLGSEGYKIAIAPNGSKALELIPKIQPALILLDVMMPDINGYDVCRKIKQDPNTKDIPVIFISAKSDIEDTIEGFKIGAVDYIAKPFRHEEVLHRVKIQLQLRTSMLEVERQNKKLIELDKTKNRVMGTVAHDLRNPIGAITGYAELILDEFNSIIKIEPEVVKDTLEKIRSISLQLNTLVNDLLDSSAIEHGSLTLNKSSFSVTSLIKERINICEYRLKSRNIKLLLDVVDDVTVTADSPRIAQVIDNIICNGIKFSPENSQINVKIIKHDKQIRISIKNQGQGIAEDKLESIFNPFSENSTALSSGDKSTGLGLAIVKKIIEVHQGEIFVESKLGYGADFIICLPLENTL